MDQQTSGLPADSSAPEDAIGDLRLTDTGVRPEAPGSTDATAEVLRYRGRIDEIDRQLIELIRERISVSAKVQAARMSTGGPHLSLSREMQIIGRYRKALGRLGTDMALVLLQLSRGTTRGERRKCDEIPLSGS